eukprot:NODE_183_length_15731_cov_0.226778.p3 type:complete len:364 gc:universal NODE_183_length_15731_cov_0.226778:2922-1831(-)
MFIGNSVIVILYATIGITMFYANRSSILIINRLPKMVYIEAISTIFSCLINNLESNEEVSKYIPCYVSCVIYGPAASLSIVLTICRISYLYGYLIKSTSKYTLRKLFWRNNNLIKKNFFWVVAVLIIGSWINSFSYFIVNDDWSRPGPLRNQPCNFVTLLFPAVVSMASTLLQFAFAIKIIYMRAFDQIGMSYELIGYSFSSFILFSLSFILFGTILPTIVYISCLINLSFILYFPMLMILKHKVVLRNNLSIKKNRVSLDLELDERIRVLCKRFLCEEISFFVDKYKEYKQGTADFDNMVSLFIGYGSLYELNIPHELKTIVLNSKSPEEQIIIIDKVHYEVLQMIKENIMPYIEQVSTTKI